MVEVIKVEGWEVYQATLLKLPQKNKLDNRH